MQLLELLDRISKLGASNLPASATPELSVARSGADGFVEPTLSIEVGDISTAQVIIVSAPGAVGKSTLAREVSRQSGSPLWDLAKAGPIGQNSLLGALTNAFGFQPAMTLASNLQSGQACFLIDAMDEARIKITDQAFNAFLADVAQLASKSPRTAFVLFGRTQVAESAWLEIERHQAKAALVMIDWFSRDQAKIYIERRLTTHDSSFAAAITSFRSSFNSARDKLFELLDKAVAHDKSTESFTGYAPVLDAMAVWLGDSTNFEATYRHLEQFDIDNLALGSAPVTLLQRICDEILTREHRNKLTTAIRQPLESVALKHEWDRWDSLYQIPEQCERLMSRLLGVTHHPALDIPQEVRAKYEEHLASFIGEHPFLRNASQAANAVFEAYLFARALFLAPPSLRSPVTAKFTAGTGPSTRLLADFYFQLMRSAGADLVPIDHISPLLRSLCSAESATTHVGLLLEGEEPEQEGPEFSFADGEFIMCNHGKGEPVQTSYEFKTVIKQDSVLPMAGPMAEMLVTIPGTVQLAAPSGELKLGPAVSIEARRLEIGAQSIVVNSERAHPLPDAPPDPTVTLTALECDCATVSQITARGTLQVQWPESTRYPWTPFNHEPGPPSLQADARLRTAFLRFTRIVMTLRSHSKGSLARYRHKVEHQRVLKGRIGQALLDSMLSDGMLILVGNFYHWVPAAASHLVGISWLDLRQRRASPQLVEYLSRFVEANSALFAS